MAEKLRLITSIKDRMSLIARESVVAVHFTSTQKLRRPQVGWRISDAILLQPAAYGAAVWPLPYDANYSGQDAILLQTMMNAHPNPVLQDVAFPYETVPKATFANSKDLHYVTKRPINWLVRAIETGLKEMAIDYRIREATLVCRLTQKIDGMAYLESIGIKFKRLQFRSLCGFKVTGVLHPTRIIPVSEEVKHTEQFREIIKDIVERAESET